MKFAPEDVHVTVYKKDGHVYVFFWRDENLPRLRQAIGRFAANPDLNLTYFDAARLAVHAAEKIRKK